MVRQCKSCRKTNTLHKVPEPQINPEKRTSMLKTINREDLYDTNVSVYVCDNCLNQDVEDSVEYENYEVLDEFQEEVMEVEAAIEYQHEDIIQVDSIQIQSLLHASC